MNESKNANKSKSDTSNSKFLQIKKTSKGILLLNNDNNKLFLVQNYNIKKEKVVLELSNILKKHEANIVNICIFKTHEKFISILEQYISDLDLGSFLESHMEEKLPIDSFFILAHDFINILKTLYSNNIYHGDISLNNLIMDDTHVYLTNFKKSLIINDNTKYKTLFSKDFEQFKFLLSEIYKVTNSSKEIDNFFVKLELLNVEDSNFLLNLESILLLKEEDNVAKKYNIIEKYNLTPIITSLNNLSTSKISKVHITAVILSVFIISCLGYTIFNAQFDYEEVTTTNIETPIYSAQKTITESAITSRVEPEGKEVILGYGNFIVGEDIEPGTYTLTPISGYDNVYVSNNSSGSKLNHIFGFNEVDVDAKKPKSDITLVDGAQIEMNDVELKFTPLENNVKLEENKNEFVEKVEYRNNLYTCSIDDNVVDCNSLSSFDELKASIDEQMNISTI